MCINHSAYKHIYIYKITTTNGQIYKEAKKNFSQ